MNNLTFDIGSLLWYMGSMSLTYVLARMYEKSHRRIFLIFAYLSISFFCGFRFFVGNDYYEYYEGISISQSYHANIYLWEPSFYFLIQLFANSKIGYLYVMLSASLIVYFFVFKVLLEKKRLSGGLLFVYLLGFLILANDIVRQGIAMSIYFYALKFIEKGNFVKYLFLCIFSASFHYSALVLVPFYFLRYLKGNRLIWTFLFVLALIMEVSGLTKSIANTFYNLVPHYGERFDMKDDRYISESVFGLGFLYNYMLGILVIFLHDFKQTNIYITLYLTGSLLMTIFFGLQVIERVAFYLFYTNFLVYALFLKKIRPSTLYKPVLFCMLLYYGVQSLTGMEKHGAVPYRTFVGENITRPPYEREYND